MKWNIVMPILIILVVMGLAYAVENPHNPSYNQTSHRITHEDILEFEHTPLGAMRIWSQGKLKGAAGFALSGTVGGEDYYALCSDFSWSWWNETVVYNVSYSYWDEELNETINVTEEWKNITLYGYNNVPNFAWMQEWHFSPNEPAKITHKVYNGLAPVENMKLWYINTLRDGTTIHYNNKKYIVRSTDFIHLEGDYLNDLIPSVRIDYGYTFDYGDLLEDYNITDLIIGNFKDYFRLEDDLILWGVGVTKNNGSFGVGEIWELDPTVTSWIVPSGYGDPTNQWTNGGNIFVSDNARAEESRLYEKLDTNNYSISSTVPDGSTILGIEVRTEGKQISPFSPCTPGWGAKTGIDLSWDSGSTYSEQNEQSVVCTSGDTLKYYGNLTYLWGRTWTTDELNDTNFRLRLALSYISKFGGGDTAIDQVVLRINYTTPSLDLSYVAPTPDDENNVSATMTVNATSNNDLSYCILQYNSSGSWANKSMTISDDDRGCYTTIKRLNNVNFSFNIYGEDTESSVNITTTRDVYVNNSVPTATVHSPLNNTFYYLNHTIINFTISDKEDDLKRIAVFMSNDSSNVDKDSILYYYDEALNGTYDFNFTALPTQMQGKIYAMYHLDRAEIWNENDSFVYDHSGHGYDGVVGTGVACPMFNISGKIAGSYELDGANDKINIGNGLDDFWDWCNNSNNCAVSAWVYLKNDADHSTIASRYRSSGEDLFFWFFYNKLDGKLTFRIGRDGTGAADLCSATGDFSSYFNEWTHVTGQYNGTDTFVYANGVLLGSTTCAFSGLDFDAWQDSEQTEIGVYSGSLAGLNGTIDEVVFWNDTLTTAELLDMYSLNTGRYYWNINVSDADDSADEEDLTFVLGSSCVYSGTGDWSIDCTENCPSLGSSVDLGGSNWILSGDGIYPVSSGISVLNWSNLTVKNSCDLIGYDPVEWL